MMERRSLGELGGYLITIDSGMVFRKRLGAVKEIVPLILITRTYS
jgi:hypothetical protein